MNHGNPDALALLPCLMLVCFGIFALIMLAFWIWVIVDVVKNEPSEGNDKIVWLLVVILLSWVGALIYLLARRPKRVRELGR
jgi:hypothetical protein